jgi:hypothetical protein
MKASAFISCPPVGMAERAAATIYGMKMPVSPEEEVGGGFRVEGLGIAATARIYVRMCVYVLRYMCDLWF